MSLLVDRLAVTTNNREPALGCMRTTPTLDDDVAALVEEVRKARQAPLRRVINEALRQGLRELVAPPPRRKPLRTRSVSLGRCLVDSIDDVAEALAVAEGESAPVRRSESA